MIGTKENWTDKNNLRNYPISVSRGNFPQSLLVDAFVTIKDENIFPCISSVNYTGKIASVVFSDAISGVELFVAMHAVGGTNIAESVISANVDAVGYIKFGSISDVQIGITKYNLGDIMLLDHCFLNIGKPAITSIKVDGNPSEILNEFNFSAIGDFSITKSNYITQLTGEESIYTISCSSQYNHPCDYKETVCECNHQPIKNINNVYPTNAPDRTINIVSSNPLIVTDTNFYSGITINAVTKADQMCKENIAIQIGEDSTGNPITKSI